MTQREFLDIVFALVPKEANTIIDAFDEYVESAQLGTNLAQLGTDCISRQAAIDAVSKACEEWRGIFARCEEKLLALPSAQPRGKWIYHIDDLFPAESTKECDQCHAEQPLICDDEFCPHCGAKMEVSE